MSQPTVRGGLQRVHGGHEIRFGGHHGLRWTVLPLRDPPEDRSGIVANKIKVQQNETDFLTYIAGIYVFGSEGKLYNSFTMENLPLEIRIIEDYEQFKIELEYHLWDVLLNSHAISVMSHLNSLGSSDQSLER